MSAPARRISAPLRVTAGLAALSAIAAICFLMSAPEARRTANVTELVRAACQHSGLSHTALDRLIRMNRDVAIDQDHAVRAIVAYCSRATADGRAVSD